MNFMNDNVTTEITYANNVDFRHWKSWLLQHHSSTRNLIILVVNKSATYLEYTFL
jgi:hypothetical protein